MEGSLRILLCLCIVQLVGSQLLLDIHPNVTVVSNNAIALIRCSLNLLKPKTDVVYSIMIKRRATTSAVLFRDGSYEITDEHATLESSRIIRSPAFLRLRLHNITCVDRGDYSCKMAIRRSYRNLQLGPVISTLKVIGTPDDKITVNVTPQHTDYTPGETVRVTCATLQKLKVNDWSWMRSNQSIDEQVNKCVYSENDCLYKCSSTVSHFVSAVNEEARFVCAIGGMIASKTLDVTNATTTYVLTSMSTTGIYQNAKYHFGGRLHKNRKQMYTVIATSSVTVIVLVICLLIFRASKSRPLNEVDMFIKEDNSEKGLL